MNIRKILIALAVVLLLGIILYAGEILLSRGREIDDSKLHLARVDFPAQPADSHGEYVDKELMALVKTQKEAEEIAELYEIELKGYSYGVATYVTDKDIQTLLEFGRKNNYPELSQIYYQQTDE